MAMIADMAADIGMRIARRRQQLRLTQEELAARLGVSKSTVANWERNKHFPKRKQGAVEEVLGFSLDEPPPVPAVPPRLVETIRATLPLEDQERAIEALRRELAGEPHAPTGPGGAAGSYDPPRRAG